MNTPIHPCTALGGETSWHSVCVESVAEFVSTGIICDDDDKTKMEDE